MSPRLSSIFSGTSSKVFPLYSQPVSYREIILFGVISVAACNRNDSIRRSRMASLKEEVPPQQWRPEPTEATEDDGEEREEEGNQENLNVLHLLYTIAQVIGPRTFFYMEAKVRIKHIKMDLYIEGFRVTSAMRNPFGGYDTIV